MLAADYVVPKRACHRQALHTQEDEISGLCALGCIHGPQYHFWYRACRPGDNICGPAEDVPCGVRGFPICFGEQALCSQLLFATFPEMICIDSARSESPQPCGVLGSTACIGLACTSPLVVQPSTAVCVPSASVPCGGSEQSQCFWDGRRPCDEGLFSENGICRRR